MIPIVSSLTETHKKLFQTLSIVINTNCSSRIGIYLPPTWLSFHVIISDLNGGIFKPTFSTVYIDLIMVKRAEEKKKNQIEEQRPRWPDI